MCPQRRSLGIQKARGPRLLPDPFVPKPRVVAHTEHLVKGTPGRENDCALGLDDALVFGPQPLQVNNRVPGIGGDAVGRVRKNHVHAARGEQLHALKAIGVVDAIDRKIGLWQVRGVLTPYTTPGPCGSLNSAANRSTGRVAATPEKDRGDSRRAGLLGWRTCHPRFSLCSGSS